MTKKKSKEIKQLKYLLLIPLLASMVLYTSCNNNEDVKSSEKEIVTIYNNKKGSLTSVKGKEESYLDFYYGDAKADLGKELSIKELSEDEKEEFMKINDKLNSSKVASMMKLKIFSGFKGRKIIAHFFDFSKVKKENYKEGEYASFATLDKHPTFPGCEEGNKKCFNQSMIKFIQDNFDGELANTLGLEPGKKRIYVQFRIDKEGKVIDIKARAPHPSLKEHAMEVASKLPIMKPGEKDGKVVKTGYTLPITFNVE